MSVRREKIVDKKSGKTKYAWRIDILWTTPSGKQQRIRKRSPIPTRRGALETERQIRAELSAGSFKRKEEKKATVNEFSELFMTTHARVENKPSEIKSKEAILKHHILPHFGNYLIDEIPGIAIPKFKERQKLLGLANKTINNQLIVLTTMLNRAEEWGAMKKAPKIKKLKVALSDPDFLTFDEASRLVTAGESDPEWQSVVVVALNTGLRLGELLALQWDDLDLISGKMSVLRSDWQGQIGTPKSGKPRKIPLNAIALKVLKEQRHLRGPLVWCQKDGSAYNKDHFKNGLRRIRKKSGLRHFEWHVLRHTFASHLIMRNVSIRAVQELLGHSSIQMTMRYAHLAPDVGVRAVDALVGEQSAESWPHSGHTRN